MNAENMYDAWDNGDRHEIRQQFARREEIIRMAREAGIGWWLDDGKLEQFATRVAAAEREACAKLVDLESSLLGRELQSAAAIRARGD